MNNPIGLTPDDHALRLFFQGDTLYLESEATSIKNNPAPNSSDEKSEPEEHIHVVFEGGNQPELLLIFYHDEHKTLGTEWSDMIKGMLFNEKAMNKTANQVAMINLQLNPDVAFSDLLKKFHPTQIMTWGLKTIGDLPLTLGNGPIQHGRTTIHPLESPHLYLSAEAKASLWSYIKKHVLR